MASKLFRAVVGFGIGLGAASAACFGATDGTTVGGDVSADGKDASTAKVPGKTTSYEDPPSTEDPSETPTADASPDVKVVADAGIDAPKDVGADAFCDAAWPTTKGNNSGPTCGPIDACGDAGPAPRCYQLVGSAVCNPNNTGAVAFCVGGTWQCSSAAVPASQCTCFGPLEAGQTCP